MSYPRESFWHKLRELFSVRRRSRRIEMKTYDLMRLNIDLMRLNAKLQSELNNRGAK